MGNGILRRRQVRALTAGVTPGYSPGTIPFGDGPEGVSMSRDPAVAIRNARLFALAQAAGHRLQALSSRLLEVRTSRGGAAARGG